MDGWMDGWMDRWIDGLMEIKLEDSPNEQVILLDFFLLINDG